MMALGDRVGACAPPAPPPAPAGRPHCGRLSPGQAYRLHLQHDHECFRRHRAGAEGIVLQCGMDFVSEALTDHVGRHGGAHLIGGKIYATCA